MGMGGPHEREKGSNKNNTKVKRHCSGITKKLLVRGKEVPGGKSKEMCERRRDMVTISKNTLQQSQRNCEGSHNYAIRMVWGVEAKEPTKKEGKTEKRGGWGFTESGANQSKRKHDGCDTVPRNTEG